MSENSHEMQGELNGLWGLHTHFMGTEGQGRGELSQEEPGGPGEPAAGGRWSPEAGQETLGACPPHQPSLLWASQQVCRADAREAARLSTRRQASGFPFSTHATALGTRLGEVSAVTDGGTRGRQLSY